MASEAALTLLKIDLGFLQPDLPEDIRKYMGQRLDAALARLNADGISIDESKAGDMDILIMYAAYLYRRRDSDMPMPKALRQAINDAKVSNITSGTGGAP